MIKLYPIGLALLFILYIIALSGCILFLIYTISTSKQAEYYLLKPWILCNIATKYKEYECPYCAHHIKVYDNDTLPDKCPECSHKVRNEGF